MRSSLTFVIFSLFLIIQSPPSRSCHFVAKGIATVLRENVCYKKRELRQSLNHIIHCPSFSKDCKAMAKEHHALVHPESLRYLIISGLYREIFKLREQSCPCAKDDFQLWTKKEPTGDSQGY